LATYQQGSHEQYVPRAVLYGPSLCEIEAKLEAEYELPLGSMRAIRTRGGRSNANQVSGAGALSVYPIIPNTRRGFMHKERLAFREDRVVLIAD
jgi:hypothetical protein